MYKVWCLIGLCLEVLGLIGSITNPRKFLKVRWLGHYLSGSGRDMTLSKGYIKKLSSNMLELDWQSKHCYYGFEPVVDSWLYHIVGGFSTRYDKSKDQYTVTDRYDWHPDRNGEFAKISFAIGSKYYHRIPSRIRIIASDILIFISNSMIWLDSDDGNIFVSDEFWVQKGKVFDTKFSLDVAAGASIVITSEDVITMLEYLDVGDEMIVTEDLSFLSRDKCILYAKYKGYIYPVTIISDYDKNQDRLPIYEDENVKIVLKDDKAILVMA